MELASLVAGRIFADRHHTNAPTRNPHADRKRETIIARLVGWNGFTDVVGIFDECAEGFLENPFVGGEE